MKITFESRLDLKSQGIKFYQYLTERLVLAWEKQGESDSKPFVRKVGSCLEPEEKMTAMEWLVFDGATLLAVGTSFGALLLFSQKGTLLIKQVRSCQSLDSKQMIL